ncbi:MAG: hypothetical protein KA354_03510 [Phycisphaerae bacterium]|nr:hypothetical protein [Phycisphaerae bacterium]
MYPEDSGQRTGVGLVMRIVVGLLLTSTFAAQGAPLITSVTDVAGNPPLMNYGGIYGSQRENDSGYPNATPPVAPAILYFGDRVFCMTDRTHQYVAPRFEATSGVLGGDALGVIPPYLVGGEYVSTRNDNKNVAGFQISVTVGADVTAYLLIDNRNGDTNNGNPPTLGNGTMDWVAADGWTQADTGLSPNMPDGSRQPDFVGIDEGSNLNPDPPNTGADFNNRLTLTTNLTGAPDNYFTVYKQEFNAGATIVLKEGDLVNSNNVHGMVVVPRPRVVPVCGLLVGPGNVSAQTAAGGADPVDSVVTVRAFGDGPVSYQAQELDADQNVANVPWMSLSKTLGGPVAPLGSDTLSIIYSITGLKVGVYKAYVRITDTCDPTRTYLSEVTLRILPADSVIIGISESGGDGAGWPGAPTSQRENDYGYPTAVPPISGAIVPFDASAPGARVFAFTDRTHQYVSARYVEGSGVLATGGGNVAPGIPPYLVGGEYVSTRNNNRDNAAFKLNVTINPNLTRGVWAYLLLDNRLGPSGNQSNADPPVLGNGLMDWVATDGWAQYSTGMFPNGQPDYVGIDEGGTPGSWNDRAVNAGGLDQYPTQFYTVYRKGFAGGEIIPLQQQNGGGINMYGLVVVPRIPCQLSVPGSVSATGLQDGANPTNVIVSIKNTSDDPVGVSYTVAELDENQNGADVPWLAISKLGGGPIAQGATDTLTLSFNTAGMLMGDYVAHLRFTNDCPEPKSKFMRVVLTIQPPDLRLPQRMAPNGMYVQQVGSMTWDQARVHYNANIKGNLPTFQGVPGDWTVPADRYIGTIIGSHADMWLPGTDSDGISSLDGANLGALLGTVEDTFKWLDGTAVPTGDVSVGGPWNTGEPNDYNLGVPGEDAMEIYASGLWNDNVVGTTLDPAQGGGARPYYLLYDGVDLSAQGKFRVMYRPGTTANLTEAINLLNGPAVLGDAKGQYYAISFGDPGTGGGGTGSGGAWRDWPKAPWPTDDPVVANNDDDNFVSRSTGILIVPEAGQYTFVVAHDDDCLFTVGTQQAVGGPCDGSQPVCSQTTLGGATANAVVVTFAQAGEYPMELIQREGTGASYLQLFAAQGDRTDEFNKGYRQVFRLVGDVLGGGLAVKTIPDVCGVVFADRDHDGDVDQVDFGQFQACFSGSLAAPTDCNCFDRDGSDASGDGDVDVMDLLAFMNCYTGPAVAWSQATNPDCIPERP